MKDFKLTCWVERVKNNIHAYKRESTSGKSLKNGIITVNLFCVQISNRAFNTCYF